MLTTNATLRLCRVGVVALGAASCVLIATVPAVATVRSPISWGTIYEGTSSSHNGDAYGFAGISTTQSMIETDGEVLDDKADGNGTYLYDSAYGFADGKWGGEDGYDTDRHQTADVSSSQGWVGKVWSFDLWEDATAARITMNVCEDEAFRYDPCSDGSGNGLAIVSQNY